MYVAFIYPPPLQPEVPSDGACVTKSTTAVPLHQVGTIFRALFGGGESKDDKEKAAAPKEEAKAATPAAATRDVPVS